jgi:hypothetical protein
MTAKPEAGRALDAAVAEHMMGFTRWRLDGKPMLCKPEVVEQIFGPASETNSHRDLLLAEGSADDVISLEDGLNHVPKYSVDITQAMDVLCFARAGNRNFLIGIESERYYCYVALTDNYGKKGTGVTIAEAICRCALALPKPKKKA